MRPTPPREWIAALVALLALVAGCGGALSDLEDDGLLEADLVGCPTLAVTGTTVAASGEQAPNVATNVLDGDLGTRWSSEGRGQHLTLDLGSAHDVCALRVAWYQGTSRVNDFAVGVSSDGVAFTEVYRGKSSGGRARLETYDVADRQARWVRLTVNGNTVNTWASVTEVRVGGVRVNVPVDAGVPATPDAGTVAPPPPPPTTGGKPDASNTGVPGGTTLTVHQGDLNITTPGTVVDGLDIRGFVTVNASNVTIRRSIVRGRMGVSFYGGAIDVRGGTNVLIEDTEVAITTPLVSIDGIWLGASGVASATARRVKVSGGVDGMKLGANSRVESSFVTGLAYFANDPSQGGGSTHNDCIQILSGANITLVGNNLVAGRSDNAALQVTQDYAPVTGLNVQGNWADGGGCSFNFAHKTRSSMTVNVNGNRFGRGSFYSCPILLSTQTTLVGTGNVYDDDGRAVPIQRHD